MCVFVCFLSSRFLFRARRSRKACRVLRWFSVPLSPWLGGVRHKGNCCALSIRRNYRCVRGCAPSRRWLSVMASLPAGVSSVALLCMDMVGDFWQHQSRNKQGRSWVGNYSPPPPCLLTHTSPVRSQCCTDDLLAQDMASSKRAV